MTQAIVAAAASATARSHDHVAAAAAARLRFAAHAPVLLSIGAVSPTYLLPPHPRLSLV